EANAKRFREEVQHHQAWGYPAHLIDEPALRALEPHIEPGQVAASAHAEIEGSVDPVAVTETLIKRADGAGAKVTYPAEVTGLDERGGRLQAVRTTAGDVPTDVLVIACGPDTPRIAAMAGVRVPLRDS